MFLFYIFSPYLKHLLDVYNKYYSLFNVSIQILVYVNFLLNYYLSCCDFYMSSCDLTCRKECKILRLSLRHSREAISAGN